jgi:hypothetical protein
MINDLKDLKALLKLCRNQGVTEIKLGSVELKLGDLPIENTSQQVETEQISDDPYANFPDGILSPDALAFYSAGGIPGQEPEGLL